ncbi:MAG: MarC family protein [Bryobacterales bacterium]
MDTLAALKQLISLLAIVNPIGAIPLFLAWTSSRGKIERADAARTAAITAIVALLAGVWLGDALFGFFAIRLASFRVGGGLLLLLMAIAMLQAETPGAKHAAAEEQEARSKDNVGVVPLGIPLLAGPGSISLVIDAAQRVPELAGKTVLSAEIVLVGLATWIALRSGDRIFARVGETGINVVTRLMGLILAAVAVELLAAGALALFPGLAG